MWKKWVTIHDTEDPTTFTLLRRKPHGWMFWGSFAGGKKGPCFFWEKEYGGINAEKYVSLILPLVYTFYLTAGCSLFQQDNAPSHRANYTRQTIAEIGINLLRWPANSPDLNPIENVWFWMKAWIESHYPDL